MAQDNGTDCMSHFRQGNRDHAMALYLYYICRNDSNFTAKFFEVQEQMELAHRQELPALATILAMFGFLIVFGAAGNGLVIHLICSRRGLSSPRNAFVLNLALSDFILCVATQPINMLRLLQEHMSWEYGTPLCKMVNGLTGLNLFVSTFSIMAIALDRFQVVVHPNRMLVRKELLLGCIACIWATAAVLSSPLLLFANVTMNWLRQRRMCSENSNSQLVQTAKVMYSLATLLAQYLIPLVILVVAYWRIHARLEQKIQYRRESCQSAYQMQRCQREERRHRRTNVTLLTIGLVFALSWLPLSLFNLLNDVQAWGLQNKGAEAPSGSQKLPIQLVQAASLLLILLSACVNPILYGFLNDCLRTELFKLLGCTRFLRIDEDNAASGHNQAESRGAEVQLPLIVAAFDPEEVDAWIEDVEDAAAF